MTVSSTRLDSRASLASASLFAMVMIDTSREAVSIDSAISWAPQLRRLLAERVADVVEDDQRESGDRSVGVVAGHEAA